MLSCSCLCLSLPVLPLCAHREEEESLRRKIRAAHEQALQEAKEKLRKSQQELRAEIQTEKNHMAQDLHKKEAAAPPLSPVPIPRLVGINDGDPGDPEVKQKRDKIREVSHRLWQGGGWGHGQDEGRRRVHLQCAVWLCTGKHKTAIK